MFYGEFPLTLPGIIWIACTAVSFFTCRCGIEIGSFCILTWVVTICGFCYLGMKLTEKMIFYLEFWH